MITKASKTRARSAGAGLTIVINVHWHVINKVQQNPSGSRCDSTHLLQCLDFVLIAVLTADLLRPPPEPAESALHDIKTSSQSVCMNLSRETRVASLVLHLHGAVLVDEIPSRSPP